MTEPLSPERAVRLLRVKAAGPPSTLEELAELVRIIAWLVADHIEATTNVDP